MRKKFSEIVFYMFSLLLICGVIAYQEPEKMLPLTEILAQLNPVQYGIPNELNGVWYGRGISLYIRDNQMIMHDGTNHSRRYIPSQTIVQEDFDLWNIPDSNQRMLYMIHWNQDQFRQTYPQADGHFAQQAFYLIYDQASDSLMLEDGQLLKRSPF